MRHELTLSRAVLEVGEIRTVRFVFTRDSDSTTVNVGRDSSGSPCQRDRADRLPRLQAAVIGDPSYTGSTASVNLTYVAFGSTRLGVIVGRDVQHSFDSDQPYYLQTGVSATINQQIYGPLDIEGRVSRRRLAYRNRERTDDVLEIVDRLDNVSSYGGGIGYRLGQDLRLGFNVEQANRESPLADHRYDGLRYGLAVSYGQ